MPVEGRELLEKHWPPAPANAMRVVTLGRVVFEVDNDTLYATQPFYVKRRRMIGLAVIAVVILEIFNIGYPIVTAWWFSWARSGWALFQLIAPIFFWIPVAFFATQWLVSRVLHIDAFSMTRNPGVFRTRRGRTYPLAGASISVHPSRYLHRRTHVLTLTIPAQGGEPAWRFRLATFMQLASALSAQLELMRFLDLSD